MTGPGLGLKRALVSPGNGKLLTSLRQGRAGIWFVTWRCYILVGGLREPLRLPGRSGGSARDTGVSCRQVSVFGSVMLRALWGAVGQGLPPRMCPEALPSSWVLGGSAPASGIPGLPQAPTPTLSSWNVWEISSVVHGAGWGHLPGSWTL